MVRCDLIIVTEIPQNLFAHPILRLFSPWLDFQSLWPACRRGELLRNGYQLKGKWCSVKQLVHSVDFLASLRKCCLITNGIANVCFGTRGVCFCRGAAFVEQGGDQPGNHDDRVMWAAENLSPGVIAVSESAGDPLRQLPRWRKLCRYLGVLFLLSVVGVGICIIVGFSFTTHISSSVMLLVLSPFVVPGLLALYLCTRNCCGLILNLVFAFSAILSGAVLFTTGIVTEVGVMLMVVGGLIFAVIVMTLLYNKLTGRVEGDDGEFSSGHYRDILFGDDISQQAYPNCAPLRRLESSIKSRTGSVKKKLRSEPPQHTCHKDTTLYQPDVQFIIPEIPPPSGQHSRCSPERIDLEEIALTTPEEEARGGSSQLSASSPNRSVSTPQNCYYPSPIHDFTTSTS